MYTYSVHSLHLLYLRPSVHIAFTYPASSLPGFQPCVVYQAVFITSTWVYLVLMAAHVQAPTWVNRVYTQVLMPPSCIHNSFSQGIHSPVHSKQSLLCYSFTAKELLLPPPPPLHTKFSYFDWSNSWTLYILFEPFLEHISLLAVKLADWLGFVQWQMTDPYFNPTSFCSGVLLLI